MDHSQDTTENLSRFVQRAGNLYSLPTVAMQVLELTANSTIDAPSLKECIEKDPALTAKMMKVANSPMFGMSKQVSSLQQAMVVLGLGT